jgi:hypothetical protein
MSEICAELHFMLNNYPRFYFPYNSRRIPENGIYVLFEKGETGHGMNRIVRVGTHTGEGKLPSRLKEHFLKENKDRSIFRKNIGRAILTKANDPFLDQWEMNLTSRAEKAENWHRVDHHKKAIVEKQVTEYIQNHFWFVVLPVNPKESRLKLESRLISTVSRCKECGPSMDWLGLHSPKIKIQESGLWLVNELYKEPFSRAEFDYFRKLFSN